jgi:hypothetical protein
MFKLADVPTLIKVLLTNEREERFGKAIYGADWESGKLTNEEMRHARSIADGNDVPRNQLDRGYWHLLSEMPLTVGRDPFWVYAGHYTEAAQATLPRTLARKHQVEFVRELLRLLDQYGPDFKPLEKLASDDERPKLDRARAFYRRMQEQDRELPARATVPESGAALSAEWREGSSR